MGGVIARLPGLPCLGVSQLSQPPLPFVRSRVVWSVSSPSTRLPAPRCPAAPTGSTYACTGIFQVDYSLRRRLECTSLSSISALWGNSRKIFTTACHVWCWILKLYTDCISPHKAASSPLRLPTRGRTLCFAPSRDCSAITGIPAFQPGFQGPPE